MADKIARDDAGAPGFVFLSDPGHRVIDRYGLLNPDGRGWPHPATFVIDRQGVVRWRFVEVDYRVRASNEQILEALARLGG
jgi:peroxiredoxin